MLNARRRSEELVRELDKAQMRIAALERQAETRALRDGLTDLLTLSAFGARLDEEVERSRRHGRPLSVAVVDIDGFRMLNARHGRLIGDAMLKAVACALREGTRATDVVARASADEFLVMLPETNGSDAKLCVDRVLHALEGTTLPPVGAIAASSGLAEYARPISAEGLISAAGTALDQARVLGGARSVLQSAETSSASRLGVHGDAIAGLAEALLERDRYTGEHSESVVALVEQVARGLGLDQEEVEAVRIAALLHDIGKVGIPDSILHKEGPLDDDEWVIMREHPAIGERVLRAIPGLGAVARIVRHEHERFDGSGYPDGISGAEIPIGSRIILACDAYHAMTSDRPYRAAMTHSEAVTELAKGAGGQFDPEVTEMLIGSLYGQRKPHLTPVS